MEQQNYSGRWLITGGLGFIGRRLTQHLLKHEGVSIKTFDNETVGQVSDYAALFNVDVKTNDPSGWSKPDSAIIRHVKGDIRNVDEVRNVIKDADYIIHLAANTGVEPSMNDPQYDMESNVVGTFNILESSRHLKNPPAIVFASSNAPLGAAELPANEKSPLRPLSPYGASKAAGEVYMSAYAESFDLRTAALRFGNVYGPGSLHKGSVVAKFIRRALAGQTLEIYGDGTQSRDFIYIDDLVRGIMLAATTANISGETFQLSPGSETTVQEITDSLTAALTARGHEAPDVRYTEKRKGDMQKNYSDVSKAKNKLGWIAEQDLTEGLGITVDWFLEQ